MIPAPTSAPPADVLLVEDNAAHAELVRRAFEALRLPSRFHHVSDGEAALDFLFRRGAFADPRRSPTPRMVILDLHLPKLDGLQVLDAIRDSAEIGQIPVVILTTSRTDRDIRRAYRSRANSYLVKPAEFANFERLMLEVGTYWLEWNEQPPGPHRTPEPSR